MFWEHSRDTCKLSFHYKKEWILKQNHLGYMSQVACFVWLLPGVSKLCFFTIARLGRKKKKRFEHCRLFLLLLKGGTILYTWSKYLSTAKSHIHNPEPALEASQVSVLIASGCYTEIFPFFFFVFQKKKDSTFYSKGHGPPGGGNSLFHNVPWVLSN